MAIGPIVTCIAKTFIACTAIVAMAVLFVHEADMWQIVTLAAFSLAFFLLFPEYKTTNIKVGDSKWVG